MKFRIHPLWWPALVVAAPFVLPFLAIKYLRFLANQRRAQRLNTERLENTVPLDLPELDFLEITVLVEQKARDGFLGDAGVSYLFRSNLGTLLFDVGFGPERPALGRNAAALGVCLEQVDALAISHLHPDHMGGLAALRSGSVQLAEDLGGPSGQSCFLPAEAAAPGFTCRMISQLQILTAGIATTGPLARALFFFGLTEEQVLVARLRNKGLVVFTGCGHPTLEVILSMVRAISGEPVYALGGGLHLPLTDGRGNRLGIQLQRIIGTGLPPWRSLKDEDLSAALRTIQEAGPQMVFLSAHDSCDYTLRRMESELDGRAEVLRAGAMYRL